MCKKEKFYKTPIRVRKKRQEQTMTTRKTTRTTEEPNKFNVPVALSC